MSYKIMVDCDEEGCDFSVIYGDGKLNELGPQLSDIILRVLAGDGWQVKKKRRSIHGNPSPFYTHHHTCPKHLEGASHA